MASKEALWPPVEIMDGVMSLVVDSFIIVFFLDHEKEPDTAPVEAAFLKFLSGLGQAHIRLYVDSEGDTQRLPSDPTEIVREYITEPIQSGYVAELRLLDTDRKKPRFQAQYVQDPTVSAEEEPDFRDAIWFRVSQEIFAARREEVIAFARSLTQDLPFSYGYASPALSYGQSFGAALPFVRRYPGFDVVNPVIVALDVGDGPMGPYWVNFFGRRLTTSLGGPETLRSRLSDEFDVTPCGHGGVSVTIGPNPEVGDVNRKDNLPLYRQLAAILQPSMRIPQYVYFTDPGGNGDLDAQIAWHERFLR